MIFTAAAVIANVMALSDMGGGGKMRLSTPLRAPNHRDPGAGRSRKNIRSELRDHNRPSS
jgi:hypothetical protein